MAERYTRLFTLPEKDLYCIDSPLLICAGALLKDLHTGKMIAQLKFRNICEKQITAIKVSIRAFDAFGTELEGIPEYQYLDLSLNRDVEIGSKVAVVLPNAETRSFSCVCKSVIFADGTQWISTSNDLVPLKKQETLSEHLGNLADQYQRDTTKKARYVPIVDRDLWLCSCGAINRENERSCHICSEGLETLTAALDSACLKKHHDEHNRRMKEAKIEQEKRANAKRIEDEQKAAEKRKKNAVIALIISAFAVVAIVLAVLTVTVFVPNANYNKAIELYNADHYEDAITAFAALDGYKDSTTQIEICQTAIKDREYNKALDLYNGGQYKDARSMLEKMDGYKDSVKWIGKCNDGIYGADYEEAMMLYNDGQYEAAIAVFKMLDGYKDSTDWIEKCILTKNDSIYDKAVSLTEEGHYMEALMAFYQLGDYQDSKEQVIRLREKVAVHETISGGSDHIIGLKKDGAVVGIGYAYDSAIRFTNWKDKSIQYITAGRSHSVALLTDGTVLAVGSNSNGECSVSKWKDIIAISAGDMYTVGLMSDGHVVATKCVREDRDHGQCDVDDWTDIVSVATGGCTAGLRADGTVVTAGANYFGQRDVYSWSNIKAIACGGYHTVGLKTDGTVVSTRIITHDNDLLQVEFGQSNTSNWTDIIAISAGLFHTVGLKADGTVVATGANGVGQCEVSDWTDIVAISTGERFTIGLKSDGTVVIAGTNSNNQLNASEWTNIAIP